MKKSFLFGLAAAFIAIIIVATMPAVLGGNNDTVSGLIK